MTEESVTIEQPERSKDAKMTPHRKFLEQLLTKLENLQVGVNRLLEEFKQH